MIGPLSVEDRGGFALAGGAGPDLTPLLDVLFVLLMFFVLTANSISRVFDFDLPRDEHAASRAMDDTSVVTVSVFSHGAPWGLDGRRFSSRVDFEDALRAVVSSEGRSTVVIAGERDVALERFVDLVGLLSAHDLRAAHVLVSHETQQEAGS